MTSKDDLIKEKEERVEAIDDYIEEMEKANKLVPKLQEMKKEQELEIEILKASDDVFIDEQADRLLIMERDDKGELTSSFIAAGSTMSLVSEALSHSTGTASAYMNLLNLQVENLPSSTSHPLHRLTLAAGDLAKEKSQKEEIHQNLNLLNPDLGEIFTIARDNVDKANTGILEISLAINGMRNVIQQVWGEISHLATIKKPHYWKTIQHKQLKRERHRLLVSQSLSVDESEVRRLVTHLDNLSELHGDLSQTRYGKNLLNKDDEVMNRFYTRWIFNLDGLGKLMSLIVLKKT